MSGDLVAMARSGITLLPGEAKKVAAAYDKLLAEVLELRQQVVRLERQAKAQAPLAPQDTTP